jgi:sterol desaturase/sphingolipid hydroxylase (fatty acid hydroxylase superfamily)/AraC-like DNA-binding protein
MLTPADRLVLARLDKAMNENEVWRGEDLSIGTLAALVGAPEHRLRKLINGTLGHRNFADYVNGRRIEAAKTALSDPEQALKSVSTIAYELGFASLGPFNRAFRAATGVTPTAWRQHTRRPIRTAAGRNRRRSAENRQVGLISRSARRGPAAASSWPSPRIREPPMLDPFLPFARNWLDAMQVDVTRYVVFAVGVWLVLWVVLAIPLAGRKIRDRPPPARQLLIEFACSIRSIMIFSTLGLLTFGLFRAGCCRGPTSRASWGPVWFWTSLALMIVAHDAWFYWTHRLIHDRRLFRRFHRRHHRSNNPSPFTAYSFDLGEAAINALFVPLWMMMVPTQWPVAGLFMLHQIVRNTLGHSGYELFPARRDGRPLLPWLTTVTHHDLHHAQAGWNYGLYFTWWDK